MYNENSRGQWPNSGGSGMNGIGPGGSDFGNTAAAYGGGPLTRQNASSTAIPMPMPISSSLLSASFLQQRQTQEQLGLDSRRAGASVAIPIRGARSGSEGGGDKDKVWLKELGHGHGKHSFLQRHRSSLVSTSSSNSSSSSVEDIRNRRSVWERVSAERSVADLTSLDERDPGYNISNKHVGFAPASGIAASVGASRSLVQHSVPIEIDHHHRTALRTSFDSSARTNSVGKIAGSYVDPDNADMLMRLSLSPSLSPDQLVGSYASQGMNAGDWEESQFSEADGEEELGASPGDGGCVRMYVHMHLLSLSSSIVTQSHMS
jgi:hypothetical protein